jgi:hypothetical protein
MLFSFFGMSRVQHETTANKSRKFAEMERRRGWLRRFVGVLAIGPLIESALFLLRDSGPLLRLEDLGGDWIVSLFRNVAAPIEQGAPMVFVNIDEAIYREWDEPLLLPRDRPLAGSRKRPAFHLARKVKSAERTKYRFRKIARTRVQFRTRRWI